MTIFKIIISLALVCLLGCAHNGKEISTKCPPPTSKKAIIEKIEAAQEHLIEFAARGNATAHFLSQDRRESLNNVRIYFSDRENVAIRVGHAFGTVISLGSNPDDFWFSMDYGDINEYYHGKVSNLQNCGAKGLTTFPVAEILGILDTDKLKEANLVFEAEEYGLEITDHQNRRQRCYYFDYCTNNLTRILHYEQGMVSIAASFDDYQTLNASLKLPTKTTIFAIDENLQLDISLSRFAPISLSSQARRRLFTKADPPRTATVYTLNEDCEFVIE